MSIETGPQFMNKFELHKTPEVDNSVEKLRDRGEKIPENKEARIQTHFQRIESALESKRELFTDLVKDKLFNEYTINLQNEDGTENTARINQLVQGLFESEKEILRRRGMGEELKEYGDQPKSEDHGKYIKKIFDKKTEQEKTLGNWVDYLGSEEANFYPIWFKYLALRSLQKMGKRDRDTETYSRRSANTLQPFPDLSREALALSLDAITNQYTTGTTLDLAKSDEYTDEELLAQIEIDRMADRGEFSKLYAHFQGDIEKAKREKGESTAGEWIHWPKGSDAKELCKTLEGKGTEWCTAGVDVAKGQLQSGEFYIYYTYDQNQKPIDPRVAIFLINGEISEVRGVYGKDQNIELDFVDIARDKYKEFSGSENYEKKDQDMKRLSKIEYKNKKNESLTKDDLIFLYEIDSKIEGFGYGDDPRVEEIRNQRKIQQEEDMLTIFECTKNQIAYSAEEINENTVAYIGGFIDSDGEPIPNIFQKISQIKYVYSTFPEGKIRKQDLEIGGKTEDELRQELKENKIYISPVAEFMMDKIFQSEDFKNLQNNSETIETVKLNVSSLGFLDGATTDQFFVRAGEFGLDICPPEVGIYQRLKDNKKSFHDNYRIVMKQILCRDGYPRIFDLHNGNDDPSLYSDWVGLGRRLGPDDVFMFRLRKHSQETYTWLRVTE